MLGSFVPLKPRFLTRRREIQDPERKRVGIRVYDKLLPEGRHLERAAGELPAVIVGHGGVWSIVEQRPVKVGNKAVVPIIITHIDFAGIATGKPIQRGNGVLRTSIVESDRNVPVGLTLPARDDPNAGQSGLVARNLKNPCLLSHSQRGRQDKEPKAKAKPERHQNLLKERFNRNSPVREGALLREVGNSPTIIVIPAGRSAKQIQPGVVTLIKYSTLYTPSSVCINGKSKAYAAYGAAAHRSRLHS